MSLAPPEADGPDDRVNRRDLLTGMSPMLNPDDAMTFLADRGLLGSVAERSEVWSIRHAARRNRNLVVEGPGGFGFLVKQPEDRAGGGFTTLRAEASFYELCETDPSIAGAVGGLIPRLIDHEPESARLVLHLVRDAVDIDALDLERKPIGFVAGVAQALGRAISASHRAFRGLVAAADPRLAFLRNEPPDAFTLTRPRPADLTTLSAAGARALRLLQRDPDVDNRLAALLKQWRSETVVHGDLKFDNVLVVGKSGNPECESVRLVDWEMVQVGDPAYDLATVLDQLVVRWAFSMPPTPGLPAETLARRAGFPEAVMQAAARALWSGYKEVAELSRAEGDALLRRAVAFSAARIFFSCSEVVAERDVLPRQAVMLLQVGANILTNPEAARVRLYGIPLDTDSPR